MPKRILLIVLVLAAVLAAVPLSAAADGPLSVTVPVLGMTLELPEGWIDLGKSISADNEQQILEWLDNEDLLETIAGNMALESVYWAALNRDGKAAYVNLYDVELYEGCLSVSEFTGESRKIAANWAAYDYGLDSADSVEPAWLDNTDFLLARYGDPAVDGFCAVNYLFVWEGSLAGLEFVSEVPFTQEDLETFEQVAASMQSEQLTPPVPKEINDAELLPVGSEFYWNDYWLSGGTTLSLPDWMVPLDAGNLDEGLTELESLGVSEDKISQYRGFFDDPGLLVLFTNAADYHGYLIHDDSSFTDVSRIDMLDQQTIDRLVSEATANDYADEIIQSIQTGCYGGIPMLRIWSREDCEEPMDYVSYLFLSGNELYTLVFLETWELLPREHAFFDDIAASLSMGDQAASLPVNEQDDDRKVTIIAVIAVVGLIVVIIIAAVVVLILFIARRDDVSPGGETRLDPHQSDSEEPQDPQVPPVPSPDTAKFCIHCGSPLNPSDRFCSRCGAHIR